MASLWITILFLRTLPLFPTSEIFHPETSPKGPEPVSGSNPIAGRHFLMWSSYMGGSDDSGQFRSGRAI